MDMQTELVNSGWDAAKSFTDACREGSTEIGPFMSTALVARDMLEIVETLNGDGMLRYIGLCYDVSRLLGSSNVTNRALIRHFPWPGLRFYVP